MPEPGRRVGYLVSHEPNAIVARVRLKLIDCGAGKAAHAGIAGCIWTVELTGEKLKNVGPPLTEELTVRVIVEHISTVRGATDTMCIHGG